MTITITIQTSNAAFEDNAGCEVSRILTRLAGQLKGWDGNASLRLGLFDHNGNRVGTAEVGEP